MHGVFEIYKFSGGYPRAFYEAITKQRAGALTISDARYLDDIYSLLTSDSKKFSLDEDVLKRILVQLETPCLKLRHDLETLGRGTISKDDIRKYIDYLEKSGLFMMIPQIKAISDDDIRKKSVNERGDIFKFVVADPAAFLAIYSGTRNITSVFSKAQSFFLGAEKGSFFESIILSHLRYLPSGFSFENIGYAHASGQAEELADAVLWYVNEKNEFIIIAVEAKSYDSINEQDLFRKSEELKKNFGIKRLIVVTDSHYFKETDNYIILPVEIFLLIF